MPLLGSKKNAANKSSRNATRKKFHKLEEMTSVALWERTFECRKQTVMKKAKELELSCGVLVCKRLFCVNLSDFLFCDKKTITIICN